MISHYSKKRLANAVILAIGFAGTSSVSADPVATWQLHDFDGDGLSSDFAFYAAPPGNGAQQFAAGPAGDGAPINFDGSTLATCTVDPVNCMSTGFNFGGTGVFEPNLSTGGALGDIVIDKFGNRALTFSALNFAGHFNGTVFFLAPDSLAPGSGGPSGGPGDGVLATVSDQGSGNFAALVKYVGTINDPGGSFHLFPSNWRLEGTMTVNDQPPLVFINGNPAGDVAGDATANAPSNTVYADAGAVCQDVVDGEITGAAFTTTINNPNDPNTGPDGSQFTVDYQCTDSQSNVTTATRTVQMGPDTTPPQVTLGVGVAEPGRIDAIDGSVVDILVGVPYVDASATCSDNRDGPIVLGSVTPPFSVAPNPPAVLTSVPSTGNLITFSCDDTAVNGPTVVIRTVNVLADNQPPVISLGGANPATVAVGGTYVEDPGNTCSDTNPIDTGVVDISANLNINPTSIDASVPGSFTITYDCQDATGNPAVQKARIVNVVAGQNFRITSMTVSDIDGDQIAGCFTFSSVLDATCSGAHRFSSDGTAVTDKTDIGNQTLPGVGDDLDGGNPIGIKFDEFQPVTDFIDPNPIAVDATIAPLPVGRISPGFNYLNHPFVPVTFDPPSESAAPPSGFVTATGNGGILTITSFPFGGLYNSNKANIFFLDPDEGTLSANILSDNGDNTFNYKMSWTHRITLTEDPKNSFVGFTSRWSTEGVVTVDPAPFVVNATPEITSTSVQQGGRSPTFTIVANGGLVTANVSAVDSDAGDTLSYDWSQNSVQASDGVTDQTAFTFDPVALTAGPLALKVIVTDDNASSPLSAEAEIILNVIVAAPVLSTSTDSDADGISDAVEGFGDTDNDGISDYQDPVDGTIDPGRNRVDFRNPSLGDIVASTGRLRVGSVAAAKADGTFIVTEGDIQQHGGPGAKPTSNFHDRLKDVQDIGPIPNGIRDFIVENVPVGDLVQIVIPQSQPLPVLPLYRKYKPDGGWRFFARVSGNAYGSAKKVSGVCPGPGDAAYDSPVDANGDTIMVEGDDCIRLTILDGGTNDADGLRNGVIVDPGTPSANGSVSGAVSSNENPFGGGGCVLKLTSEGAGLRGDWWILLLAISMLGANMRLHSNEKAKQ